MRKGLLVAVVISACLAAAEQAPGDDIKVSMPPEAVGFSGTLLGQEAKLGNGWSVIRVSKVLALDAKNKTKLKADALTAAWMDKYVAILPAAKGADPMPQVSVGDMVMVTAVQFEAHLRFTKVVVLKPGEDEPDCYVFVRKSPNGNGVNLTLRKMLQDTVVAMPMEKAPGGGALAPKADLLAIVNGLVPESVVMVQMDRGLLKTIKPYEPPSSGEFVKFATQKVGEKDMPVVEIKDAAGESRALLLPANDASLAAVAQAMKPGAAIVYRTQGSDKDARLTFIKSAPIPSPATQPAGAASTGPAEAK